MFELLLKISMFGKINGFLFLFGINVFYYYPAMPDYTKRQLSSATGFAPDSNQSTGKSGHFGLCVISLFRLTPVGHVTMNKL